MTLVRTPDVVRDCGDIFRLPFARVIPCGSMRTVPQDAFGKSGGLSVPGHRDSWRPCEGPHPRAGVDHFDGLLRAPFASDVLVDRRLAGMSLIDAPAVRGRLGALAVGAADLGWVLVVDYESGRTRLLSPKAGRG